MTIFLTGEWGVGKSTALRRALAGGALGVGGFMTDFGETRREENKTLWLLPWQPEPDFAAGQVCARLGPHGRQVFPEVFDGLGAELLRAAALDPACQLLLLDELGFLEAEAAGFRAAVKSVLKGPKPVLGVVRKGLGVWQDVDLGEIWEVTEANREEIPRLLRRHLGL